MELDFDFKCVIIECLLTDEYLSGQTKIGFYSSMDENNNILPTPRE